MFGFFVHQMKHILIEERNLSNLLEHFSETKRFLEVGLKNYIEKDFKFLFFKKCLSHLNNSPQFSTLHQCRDTQKGSTAVYRCIKFYAKALKCQSRVKFCYFRKDDSLEVVSHGQCDHFQIFNIPASKVNIELELVSNSNKKIKLSLL